MSENAEVVEALAEALFRMSEADVHSLADWSSCADWRKDRFRINADFLVRTLGFEQVGWWCSNGKPYLILGPDIHDANGHTHEPVYRAAAIGRPT